MVLIVLLGLTVELNGTSKPNQADVILECLGVVATVAVVVFNVNVLYGWCTHSVLTVRVGADVVLPQPHLRSRSWHRENISRIRRDEEW